MALLRHIVLFIHLTAAVFWIGEMIFVAIVVGPYGRTLNDPLARSTLYRETGKRTLTLIWIAIAVLLTTGVLNIVLMGIPLAALGTASFWATAFGRILALKIISVATMVTFAGLHDFVHARKTREIRQRLTTAAVEERPALMARYEHHQARAALYGRTNLLIGIGVLFFAAGLIVWGG